MKFRLVHLVATIVTACFLAIVCAGCGGKHSLKSDAAELERAFGLKAGAPPSPEATPSATASRAVAALRARDWPRAFSLLSWLRLYATMTPDQARAVQNAHGNTHLRLSELAAKGNPEANAALDRARKEADRH